MEILEARVIQKVGTEAEWLANPLPLLDGEAAIVRTGDGTPVNLKFGDGGKTFAELPYFIDYSQAAYIAYEATPTQPIAYTFVGEGTYGAITVAEGYMAVLGWDGANWSKNAEIEVPMQDISGLVTKSEFSTVAPVAPMLITSNQLLDNSTFKFGRWNEDGSIVATNNELRSELIPIDASKGNITFSGGTAFSTAGARFVFKDDDGVLIGFSDNNTATIPAGTTQVGVTIAYNTSMGADPTNTIYKNTAMLNYGTVALPWEAYSVFIDGEYINNLSTSNINGFDEAVEQSANNAVDDKLKPINQGLDFLLEDYDKYTFFDGVSGEVVLDQFVLDSTGDYIEWVSKPSPDFASNQLYGMFGTRSVNNKNVLGYYPLTGGIVNEIGLRENVASGTAPWIRFDGLGDLKGDFHKFKLIVNGSNWELYVNDVLKGTKPKLNSFVVNNIGFSYTPYAKFYLKGVTIHTSSSDLSSNEVEFLPGATSGVYGRYENLNPDIDVLSPFYVSYTPTGIDAAGLPLFGKFTVYCKRDGYSNSYSGIEVWHEVDMSAEVWKDYWRIGFAEEYSLNDGGQMTRTYQKVLATGESESVWKRQNTPYPKSDFTGGWHGDEIMRSNAFKMLINGNEVSLSTAFDMVPANSVEYSVMSDMTEVADVIEGVITPVPGHPIDCSHYKRTTFKVGGYDTYNKMVWARPVPVMLWDFGICCFGKVQGTQGFNDSVVSSSFNLQDNSYHLSKNDGNLVNYQNTSTELSGSVYSNMIKPVNKGDKCLMRVQDRFYDSKYYNMYQENVTTTTGEVWESIMQVRFS